jgi:glycosyltransferase involved in cell wall biosynthesis
LRCRQEACRSRGGLTETSFEVAVKRIGLFLTPTKGWLGGINYFRNLFLAISASDDPHVEICVIVPSLVDSDALAMMLPVPARLIVVRTALLQKGHPLWLLWRTFRKLFGSELVARPLARRLRLSAISHSDFLRGTGVPVVNWLPDFQHVHLPQMFDQREVKSRAVKYSSLARHADRVIVSSEDARRDLVETLPSAAGKARVLHFVSSIPAKYWSLDENDFARVRERYGLEQKFFYVPNQFWQHKNHLILLESIGIAKARNLRLQIVCSGATADHRNPAHYARFLERAEAIGCGDSLKILGVIPYEDVLTLIRFSCAVVNPSRFEGWSSTVEECKSAGKRMLLSDIPVHREQMPEAAFFDPTRAVELADLLEASLSLPEPSAPGLTRAPANQERLAEYGRRYLAIVDEAIEAKAAG